jgi:hypothetical protein
MWSLKAFLLGALAAGLVAYALAAAAAITVQAAGHTLEIAVGPIVLVAVVEQGGAVVTTFGTGLALVALAGGIVNLLAANVLRRRAGREVDRVD